jgi:site-specific recombinase XerD
MIDRIVELDKSKAKQDLDVSTLVHEINTKVVNIDDLMLVCGEAQRLGITGISTYANKIKPLYSYLATLNYSSIRDIDDATIRDYVLKVNHGETDAAKTSLYKYAKYFFNFIQEKNIYYEDEKPYFFNIGKDVDGNPVPLLRIHKTQKELVFLSTKELKQLDTSILTYPYKNELDKIKTILIMRFFIYSGITATELISLTFDDIVELNDSDKNTVLEIEVGASKKRVVPIPRKRFIKYLNAYRELVECDSVFFCSKNKTTRTSRQTVSLIVKTQLEYADIHKRQMTPEILKNSFGIYLSKMGVSDKKIQKLLGHNNLQTTRNLIKAGQSVADKVSVADLFEELI